MSKAITHSANAVRLPTRVCSSQNFRFSIVNSMSHMSRKWPSSVSIDVRSSVYAAGSSCSSSAIRSVLRMPATTSSPCAFER